MVINIYIGYYIFIHGFEIQNFCKNVIIHDGIYIGKQKQS